MNTQGEETTHTYTIAYTCMSTCAYILIHTSIHIHTLATLLSN